LGVEFTSLPDPFRRLINVHGFLFSWNANPVTPSTTSPVSIAINKWA
jgi:hypothetical protein